MSRRRPLPAALLVLAGALLAVAAGHASPGDEARFLRLETQSDFLGGTFEGIAVDPLGTLSLAARAERLAALDEPFLFAVAAHARGYVVGTGNGGKVLRVALDGSVTTLFTAPEPEIFAVWSDPDGTVFAGSSPSGKVYRVTAAGGEPFFDPGEVYIWSLARAADGRLLVATGTEGRVYAVGPDGEGEILYDTDDTHARALAPLAGGDVLVGTAGEGLVLRLGADGSARTLYDSSHPEVVAFAEAGDGSAYAAVLASEASLVDLGRQQAAAGQVQSATAGGGQVTVTVSEAGDAKDPFSGSRPAAFKGPRSEILRIAPSGRVESVWRFEDKTVYSLGRRGDRLWVGTGLEGELFSLRGTRMVLEQDVAERQIVALADGPGGPVFATTNSAALYRFTGASETRGSYTSPVIDAGQVARFGTLAWRGEAAAGKVLFSLRSGMSAEPDATWSAWTAPRGGSELALAAVPSGRYLQWRATLESASASPTLGEVTVSYRQINLPPRVEELEVLAPGEILVPTSFSPGNQAYEPAHPSREGIFTTLDGGRAGNGSRQKTLWKKGYRTLTWEVEDPNGDELTYALSFRREGAGGAWLPVRDDIEDSYISFDATALPDGIYRFRLEARDRDGARAAEALVAEELSEAVTVDNTPPERRSVTRADTRLRVEIADALNPLRAAEWSVDAAEWVPAEAADGLLDGRTETLEIALPEAAEMLLLRVSDAAFNLATFDLSEELE